MKTASVSMRKWFLWGAIPCGMINVFSSVAAAAMLLVWLAYGMKRIDNDVNCWYKRKTGPARESARAFLVLTISVSGLYVINRMTSYSVLEQVWVSKIVRFCLPFGVLNVSEHLLRNRMSIRTNWLIGLMCLCLILLL